MKSGHIIALLAACGMLGWFYPDLTAPPADEVGTDAHVIQTGAKAAPPQGDEDIDVLHEQQWLAGETVLRRESDGHFYADVTAADTPLRMMIDTGASVVALTGDDARAMGLRWEESQVMPIGKGASGTVSGVSTMIERMQLDGIEIREVRAVIIPEGLPVSLLGQSFLSQVKRVEIAGDEMVLGG